LNDSTNQAKKKKKIKFSTNSLKSLPLKTSKLKEEVLNRDMLNGRVTKIATMVAIFKIAEVLTFFNIFIFNGFV
jgi:hypothetical protein